MFLAGFLSNEAADDKRDTSWQRIVWGTRHRTRWWVLYVCCLLCVPVWAQSSGDDVADEPVFEIEIPASNAAEALNRLAEQTGAILLFPYDLAESRQTNAVAGQYTLMKALSELLKDSGLSGGLSDRRVIQIAADDASTTTIDDTSKSGENAMNATKKAGLFAIIAGVLSGGVDAQEPTDDEAAQTEERSALPTISQQRDSEEIRKDEEAAKAKRGLAEFVTIDEIIVRGKNVGVRRFEDDPQPYVIFNADDIENSHATNLEDFLRTRLPQNTQPGSARQFQASFTESPGNVSTIDLRGLGQDETLILINGRRAPRVSLGNNFRQADINGIPLGSIERIEILPSTASGIYGGGATGGVINIITRRNFVGGEISAEYSNTFDTDVGQRRLNGSFGFPLEGGRTNIQLSASFSDSNELLVGDRDFAQKSRDLLLRNDPDAQVTAQGTTPNIRSTRGENLVLDDGTDLGSNRTFIPFGYTGIASDGGLGLIQNAGLVNFELPEGILGKGARLIQAPTTESYSLSITRDFSPTFDVYLDASFFGNQGEAPSPGTLTNTILGADDPGNPFQNSIAVVFVNPVPDTFFTRNSSDTTQLVAGFNWRFAERWTANIDYNWSLSSFESRQDGFPFNTSSSRDTGNPESIGLRGAIALGQLDIFRDLEAFPLDFDPFRYETPIGIQFPQENELTNLAFRVSGSAFDLPAGEVNLSFLAETRESQIKGSYSNSIVPNSPAPGTRQIIYTPPREQSVDSLYAEALIPIFSESFSFPFLQELDLQASVRYDAYESASPDLRARAVLESLDDPLPEFDAARNSFDSVDYTIGFRFKPIEDVLLRASFATGFVPPNVTQIFQQELEDVIVVVSDPKRPGSAPFFFAPTFLSGGREDLRPEESESWSVGTIITPRQIPGFRFSVDYTLIEKEDEIGSLSSQELLDFEELFSDRVERAPLTPDEEALGYTGGAITLIDLTRINLERTTSESIDIQVDQFFETKNWGDFRFYAIATYTERVERQILPETPLTDRVGFDDGPLEWRANFGVTWESPSSDLLLGWNAQYYDDYLVYGANDHERKIEEEIRQHGRTTIPSQIFHDVTLTYRPDTERFSRLLNGTEIRLGIQNLFDEEPFIRPDARSRGRYSSYGDARMRRYSISVRKSF